MLTRMLDRPRGTHSLKAMLISRISGVHQRCVKCAKVQEYKEGKKR